MYVGRGFIFFFFHQKLIGLLDRCHLLIAVTDIFSHPCICKHVKLILNIYTVMMYMDI